MATKVFTAANITLGTHSGGDAAWAVVAAAMTTMNVDSGTVGTGTTIASLLAVAGTLIDDASLPTDIITSHIQYDFDYRVVSTGANPTTALSGTGEAVTDISLVNAGDVTGHHTGYVSTFSLFGGQSRADLWLANAVAWGAIQQNAVAGSTTRIVVSNFTVTLSYVNIGVGSWIVKLGAMTNPTGSTDGSALPGDAFVLGVGVGTIDIPVAATGADFIYIDGDPTPVDIAGLPAGFAFDDAFTLWNVTGLLNADDSVRYSGVTLFDVTRTLADTHGVSLMAELTGADSTTVGALFGDSVLGTMTSPTAGGIAAISNNFTADPASLGATFIVGTYTIVTVTPRVISVTPNKGTTSGGTAVTIRGEGFSAATGVEFDGTTLTDIVVVSDTVITGVTPQHISGQIDVDVIGVGTLTDGYRYVVPRVLLPPIPVRSPLLQPGDASGG